MLRTRYFLLFAVMATFLLSGIGITWMSGLAEQSSTTATALVAFEEGTVPSDVEVEAEVLNKNAIISRLRSKVASGAGDISAGEPNFDSVDTLRASVGTTTVTDQTVPDSVLVGQTMDGAPLMSDDVWRFVGWQAHQQIGVALDGAPIFGLRADTAALDECGGIDEGNGYRYYMRSDQDFTIGCND